MTPTTLKLLKLSIAHWRRLATGTAKPDEFIFGGDCALCGKFCGSRNSGCFGCPVMQRTGISHCAWTPWRDVFAVARLYSNSKKAKKSAEFQQAATAQWKFLKTLLPKKSTTNKK